MFALSVRQPWASLIICGVKRIEKRLWLPDHDFSLGSLRIAIHSCTGFDDSACDSLSIDEIKALRACGIRTRNDLQHGRILGTVDVTSWFCNDDRPPYFWSLANPIEWRVKERAIGCRGLWHLEEGIDAAYEKYQRA